MRRALASLAACLLLLAPARAEEGAPPLESVLAGAQGAERAKRLLAFIAQYPQSPQTPEAAAQARLLVDQLAESPGRLSQVFSERAPAKRLEQLDAFASLQSEWTAAVVGYVARRDQDVGVRTRAVQLLGELRDPESERTLTEIVALRTEKDAVRREAVAALGRQGTPTAGQQLLTVAKNERETAELREAAVKALRADYPELARQFERGLSDSSGSTLATLLGVGSGAYTLGLVGSLSPSEGVGATVGVLGGGIIGGGVMYLLRQEREISKKDAAFLAAAAAWSVPVGFWAGSVVDWPEPDDSGAARRSIMLLTHLGTLWGGWQLKGSFHGDSDAAFLATAALWSVPVGFTLGAVVSPKDARTVSAVALMTHLASMAGGWALKDSVTSARQATWLASAGLWGVPVGGFLGAVADSDPKTSGTADPRCERGCVSGALAGHLGALGVAWALKDKLQLTNADLGEINLGATAALLTAYGLVNLPEPKGDARPALVPLSLLPAAGFIASAYWSKDIELTAPLAMVGLVAGSELALAGTLSAEVLVKGGGPLGAFDREKLGRVQRGLAFTGFGLALGGALAASPFWKPSASDAALLSFAAFDGNMLGAGLPLLVAGGGDDWSAAKVGTSIGGLAAAALLGSQLKRVQLEEGDGLFVTTGTAFAAAQGFGWAAYLASGSSSMDADRAAGLGFTVTGLGGAALLGLSQKLQLSAWEAAWTYSGAAWGAWLSFWTGYVLTYDSLDSARSLLAATLIGSDVGLAASALLLSPLVRATPEQLLFASLCGVSGATLASMFAVFVAIDSHGPTIAASNLAGSVIGLGLGALLAPRYAGLLERKGSGGDAPKGKGLSLGLPTVGTMPVVGLDGRMDGFGAQLSWQL